MSKIFRKYRQHVLAGGRTGKYIKYALGEILLVVIGILFALHINNLKEERKLRDLRQYYYSKIKSDLEEDKNLIVARIARIDSSRAQYKSYIESFREPNLPLDVIVKNLKRLEVKSEPFEFLTATIKSLINNGETKILDPEINNYLTRYNAWKEIVCATYEKLQEDYFDIWKEVYTEGYALDPKLVDQKELAAAVSDEKRTIAMYIKLDAYHVLKADNENWFVRDLRRMVVYIDDFISFLESKSAS